MKPREISLTQGKFALVDPIDFRTVMKRKWFYQSHHNGGYAKTNMVIKGKRRGITLHRFLMGFPDAQVDHRDGNKLNNTRNNLRLADNLSNSRNRSSAAHSSRFKGVCWHKTCKAWVVGITVSGRKKKYLGSYQSEEDAARAYDEAARVEFGEFAKLNFPAEVFCPTSRTENSKL
jgi:hypothetical protein